MPTQKIKYKVLRKFTITETIDGVKSVLFFESGEEYTAGDYFEKGKYVPRKHIQLLLENEVIE